MALSRIIAECRCDGCMSKMQVEVANNACAPDGGSAYEMVEDAIRFGVEGDAGGVYSVEAGMMLCGKCSAIVLAASDSDEPMTEEEVNAALDKAMSA